MSWTVASSSFLNSAARPTRDFSASRWFAITKSRSLIAALACFRFSCASCNVSWVNSRVFCPKINFHVWVVWNIHAHAGWVGWTLKQFLHWKTISYLSMIQLDEEVCILLLLSFIQHSQVLNILSKNRVILMRNYLVWSCQFNTWTKSLQTRVATWRDQNKTLSLASNSDSIRSVLSTIACNSNKSIIWGSDSDKSPPNQLRSRRLSAYR